MKPPASPAPQVAPLLAIAAQFLRAGQPREALGPLREAARLLPGNDAILHDLGLACLECGMLGEAIAALRGSVAANPRYADAHLRLGIAHEAAGTLGEALASYRRAAELLPSLADAHYRAGALLDSLARTEAAIAGYRRAAAVAPETTLGRIAEARALLAENRDSEAETMLRRALSLDKDNAVVLELLGSTLTEAGNFAEARAMLQRAIDLSPLFAGAFYDIVRSRRILPDDAALMARMRAALAYPGLDPAQQSRLHLALGKAEDDLGNCAVAMRHFDAAEALRNNLVRFNIAEFTARVERMVARFTPAFLADEVVGGDDATPILIVGLPRSGTTLVEQILSAHPQVGGGGELPFWNERGGAWEKSGMAADAAFLAGAAADYPRLLHGIAPGAARVTDKMPQNFLWVGLIHLALPRATIIHCRRNPIDTALSIHRTFFSPRMSFPTGGAALVGYVRAYQRLCAHWRRVLPADRFIEIDYEALTSEPEPVVRRIVAACGLQWNDACLRPDLNRRAVKTPSKWQARQPFYQTSVGTWRSYEKWLGALRALVNEDVAATQ